MTRRFGVFLVAVVAAGCSSVGGTSAPGPSSTTAASAKAPNALDRVLRAYGVDVAAAPSGTAQLDGAKFCGAEDDRVGLGRAINAAARRCFLGGNAAHRSVVFVRMQGTVEGDPIVAIYRSIDSGQVDVLIDSTRDKFGSGKWERQRCTGVTTRFPDAPEPLPPSYFEAAGCAAAGGRG